MFQYLPRLARLLTAVLAAGTLVTPRLAAADPTADVYTLVNQQRAANGLPPLARNSHLDQSASSFAAQMASQGFFSHTGLDGSTPLTRMEAAGYTNVLIWGENIAAGQPDAQSVMTAWMNSPGHAANILSSSYRDIGIGVAYGGPYGIYWVQDFGTQQTSSTSTPPPPPPPPAPLISGYQSTSGAAISSAVPGAQIVIVGSNLGSSGTVTFNGITAATSNWTAGSLTASVPSASSYPYTGPVTVSTGGQSATGPTFTITAPPAPAPVPSISGYQTTGGVGITSAVPGSQIVIVGSNLGSLGTVTFNGITAAISNWTAGSITATVPTAASYPSSGPIKVTTGGQTATGPTFTITGPPAPSPSPTPSGTVTGTTMYVSAINGTSVHSDQVTAYVGQTVTLTVIAKYSSGATVDVSTSAQTTYMTSPTQGVFVAKNVWKPTSAEANKSITLYGTYLTPTGSQIRATVKVTVRP